jgi:hypothetical protein
MRKAISTIVIACAFVAGTSGVADAARSTVKPSKCGTKYTPSCKRCGTKYTPSCTKPKRCGTKYTPRCTKPKRCGTKYTPRCTRPKFTNPPLNPRCRAAGSAYKLPTFTFVSNAGLRKIKVIFDDPKTLKVVTFKGTGPKQFKLNGVRVPTKGLNAGAHHVTVTAVDITSKSVSKTLRFMICQPMPVFTG